MSTEYNPYSAAAKFWREAYLLALAHGHGDPEAVADEAFLAFESRFGVYTEEEEALCGEQQQAIGAERQFGDRLLCGMQQTSNVSIGDIVGAQRAAEEIRFLPLSDGGEPLGEGPSIEVGDAPQTVEPPDGTAHQALVADLTAHMSLVPKSPEPPLVVEDDGGDLG